jgi:hypothetical protein
MEGENGVPAARDDTDTSFSPMIIQLNPINPKNTCELS